MESIIELPKRRGEWSTRVVVEDIMESQMRALSQEIAGFDIYASD